MVNNKHIATFILGALAGLAAGKYASMTPEEKEKMMANLKAKANNLKDEAVKATDQAKDYFTELSKKGGDALKEQFPGAEKWMSDVFGNKATADNTDVATDNVVATDPVLPTEPDVPDGDNNQPNTNPAV